MKNRAAHTPAIQPTIPQNTTLHQFTERHASDHEHRQQTPGFIRPSITIDTESLSRPHRPQMNMA